MANLKARRKKTNAEIKADRAKRQRNVENEKKRIAWNELAKVHVENKNLIDVTENSVRQMLSAEVVRTALGEENLQKLDEMAIGMYADIITHRKVLADIGEKHIDKNGSASTIADTLEALQLGEEYNQWKDSFQSVVIQRANDILRIIEDVVLAPPSDDTEHDDIDDSEASAPYGELPHPAIIKETDHDA